MQPRPLSPSRRLAGLAVLLALLPLAAGCSDRPTRVKVSGQVLIDGTPVTRGTIRVIPEKARAAMSDIDAQGHFVLMTFDPGDGCVVGSHRVEVVAFDHPAPGQTRLLVPEKYNNQATSGLTVTIDGPTDKLRLDLTWAGETKKIEKAATGGDFDPSKLQSEQ
jgi:hypothetical protein